MNNALSTMWGIFGAVGTIATIVGLAWMLIRQREKRPTWAVRTTTLVSGWKDDLPGLVVSYMGKEVERLSITRFMLWNRGKDAIKKVDVPEAEPIRIRAPNGVEMLSAVVIDTNSKSSRTSVKVARNRKTAKIDFEFLDFEDGAVFQIVHSGSAVEAMSIEGRVIGASRLQQVEVIDRKNHRETLRRTIILGICSFAIYVILLALAIGGWWSGLKNDWVGTVFGLILGFLIGGAFGNWISWVNQVVPPRELDSFLDVPGYS